MRRVAGLEDVAGIGARRGTAGKETEMWAGPASPPFFLGADCCALDVRLLRISSSYFRLTKLKAQM